MRKTVFGLLAIIVLAGLMFSLATAQPPDGKGKKGKKGKGGDDGPSVPLIDRLMAFDKNKDGKLTKEEILDERLHRLFDMADTKKAGFITRADLEALAAKLGEDEGPGGKGGPGGFGKKGKGGFGKGGPGGFGGPPRPGIILPPFAVEQLELTADQKKKLDALQKEVDEKLGKILTGEQMDRLKEMRPPGPGGFRPGGPGGDGPPPEGKGKGGPKGKGRPPRDD